MSARERTEEGRALCWLNLSKLELARFTESDLNLVPAAAVK